MYFATVVVDLKFELCLNLEPSTAPALHRSLPIISKSWNSFGVLFHFASGCGFGCLFTSFLLPSFKLPRMVRSNQLIGIASVLALSVSGLPTPKRVLDGHVHLTNTTLLNYLWGNTSVGTCPCAPPCLCSWTVTQWRSASSSLSPSRFVFVEVDVNHSQWLEEAAWVQSIAALPGGDAIGAIVAQPPPGFGSSVPVSEMALELDKFSAAPLVHGVRPSISWGSLNATGFSQLLAHTHLLAVSLRVQQVRCIIVRATRSKCVTCKMQERNLSFDINAALGEDGVSAVSLDGCLHLPVVVSIPRVVLCRVQWVTKLVQESPDAQFILDHFGGPPCLGNATQVAAWKAGMAELAANNPNVAVKVRSARGALLRSLSATTDVSGLRTDCLACSFTSVGRSGDCCSATRAPQKCPMWI
jgi:predicted TIM-barrel fold metal-dependent hydrolase